MMKKNLFFRMIMGKVPPFTGVFIFLVTLTGFAQTKSITGKILSEAGTPVAGISVHVKGSNIGTTTSNNGSFTVNAAQGAILEFTGVGYIAQQVTVGQNNEITTSLPGTCGVSMKLLL